MSLGGITYLLQTSDTLGYSLLQSDLLMPLGFTQKTQREKESFLLNIEPHSLFQILFTYADYQLLLADVIAFTSCAPFPLVTEVKYYTWFSLLLGFSFFLFSKFFLFSTAHRRGMTSGETSKTVLFSLYFQIAKKHKSIV